MITILRFMADWCGPCKVMEPAWKQLQEELKDSYIFRSVDIDTDVQLRADFSVRSIPTVIVTEDGKEIARKQGSGTFPELKDWLYNVQAENS
jgi:thioredoxin-like negative regulator of GroEL